MTWDTLADVRREGLRPELPVYVTDRWSLVRNMAEIGCVSILHKRGEPMPVELLHGLDVRLDFGSCELGARVKRLMDHHEVTPRSMLAWCERCGGWSAIAGVCP